MEHLQRQQEGKLEMNLQDKQLLQTQLMFAHHAAAAARASGARLDAPLFPKADGQSYPAAQAALNTHLLHHPDDEGEETDEEEQESVDPEEQNHTEEDDEDEDNAKRARLQQVSGFPFPPYPTSQFSALKQMAESSSVKQEHEDEACSPAGQQVFTSPGDFADWGYDEQLKQVRIPPITPSVWINPHFFSSLLLFSPFSRVGNSHPAFPSHFQGGALISECSALIVESFLLSQACWPPTLLTHVWLTGRSDYR